MRTGKISWFNYCLGYGFIKPDDTSEDVYVHLSETETDSDYFYFAQGQKVKYDLKEDCLFPFASRLSVIESDLVNSSDSEFNFAQAI